MKLALETHISESIHLVLYKSKIFIVFIENQALKNCIGETLNFTIISFTIKTNHWLL